MKLEDPAVGIPAIGRPTSEEYDEFSEDTANHPLTSLLLSFSNFSIVGILMFPQVSILAAWPFGGVKRADR